MKYIGLVIIFALLFSCHSNQEGAVVESISDAEPALAMETAQQQEEDDGKPPTNGQVDKKMIRTGKLAWETERPVETRTRILKALQKVDGYVAEDNESRLYNRIQYTLVLRVPSNRFDELLTTVSEGVSAFDERDINAVDVTARYVDLTERLKTKKELEERYRQLLKKAEKVEDMLRIERAIAAERAEIESMEGQLRLLSSQVAYSTLSITLYTPIDEPVMASAGFGSRLLSGLSAGWELMENLIVGAVTIWPLWTLLALFVIGYRWYKKRKKSAGPSRQE